MRIIDLSHTIETLPDDMPAFMRVDVTYTDHAAGAIELQEAFGVPPRLLRNEEGPAGERLSIGTHAATHVDARGTTTPRSRTLPRPRSTSCRSSASSARVSSSTPVTKPTATP